MSLAILFHFLRTQHVSDVNISIIRSLRLCYWIATSVVLFLVRCVLEIWCGWVLSGVRVAGSSLQHGTENKTTDVVIQQHSRKLLVMDILMSETCWVRKKWNKIESDMKLVFYSSSITMMHGPINIRIWEVMALIDVSRCRKQGLDITRISDHTKYYDSHKMLMQMYNCLGLSSSLFETNYQRLCRPTL